jgi:type IV secretory pathway VirB10-like protein
VADTPENRPEIVPPPTAATEAPTSYRKKSQIVAIILIAILMIGMVAQSIANFKKQAERQEAKEKAELAAEGEGKNRKSSRIDDFAKDVKKVQTKEDQKADAKDDEKNREKSKRDLDNLTGDKMNDEVTEESILHAHKLNELKIALAAAGGKIGHSFAKGESGKPSNPVQMQNGNSEIDKIDAKIKALQAANMESASRRQEIYNNAAAEGISIPTQTKPQATQARTNSLPNQIFGELAGNRALSDPGATGPRPGEELLPTGSIISAITDTDMISDYPGNTIAVVQRPFYNTTMDSILLPAGTKITLKNFRVTSANEIIQNRLAIVPVWAIRPDGKRIDFKRTAGMDSAGVAAIKDQVDRHILAQILGVAGYAILGLGPSTASYGAEPNSSKDAFIKEATGQGRTAGRSFAEKYLNIVPSVTIRAGTPIKIFVEDDIYIMPWGAVDASHFRPAR